ncbi:hypothetical protein CEXT_585891 [Caerostris extrusa]|uniref:Uncharacterized protein n=1 Tax=Caerostris extrusa TaxID=172846 RepID=A0AAV4TD95_CAEEX|nr:hypothetical protein CEXT_585891 [Caerostris extrusa]
MEGQGEGYLKSGFAVHCEFRRHIVRWVLYYILHLNSLKTYPPFHLKFTFLFLRMVMLPDIQFTEGSSKNWLEKKYFFPFLVKEANEKSLQRAANNILKRRQHPESCLP